MTSNPRTLDDLKRYDPVVSYGFDYNGISPADERKDGEFVRYEDVKALLGIQNDGSEPVGNGGEREMDGEWLEDTEWLESMGFEVKCGHEPGDRTWLKKIASGIAVEVTPSGSTVLRWQCGRSNLGTELHFGLDDDATRGDIRKLLDVFGVLPQEASQDDTRNQPQPKH